ncbi:hypothetical protein P5G62_015250 [Neobacillus sp. 179-C4.2 HS]|uniref:Uncharacterized protein n=1 Tax=Neobacillus driksii TaxID=3035913 RepID=A0ABV4YWN5_9BACI|nr:hypothetical protein [Neobacillus sp. 179.-C4.2 HS]
MASEMSADWAPNGCDNISKKRPAGKAVLNTNLVIVEEGIIDL